MCYDSINDRIHAEAEYIVVHKATVREAARVFGLSKSTIFVDVTDRLYWLDYDLYNQVKLALQYNKNMRAIRGGLATKYKYASMKK